MSRSPLQCIPLEKPLSAAVNYEPSRLSMAAVGSLRREEGNKSPGTHELFTAVLSKQSAIIYLFSPAELSWECCPGCPWPAPRCPRGLGDSQGQGHPQRPQSVPWEHPCCVSSCLCIGKENKQPFLVLSACSALLWLGFLVPKATRNSKNDLAEAGEGFFFAW